MESISMHLLVWIVVCSLFGHAHGVVYVNETFETLANAIPFVGLFGSGIVGNESGPVITYGMPTELQEEDFLSFCKLVRDFLDFGDVTVNLTLRNKYKDTVMVLLEPFHVQNCPQVSKEDLDVSDMVYAYCQYVLPCKVFRSHMVEVVSPAYYLDGNLNDGTYYQQYFSIDYSFQECVRVQTVDGSKLEMFMGSNVSTSSLLAIIVDSNPYYSLLSQAYMQLLYRMVIPTMFLMWFVSFTYEIYMRRFVMMKNKVHMFGHIVNIVSSLILSGLLFAKPFGNGIEVSTPLANAIFPALIGTALLGTLISHHTWRCFVIEAQHIMVKQGKKKPKAMNPIMLASLSVGLGMSDVLPFTNSSRDGTIYLGLAVGLSVTNLVLASWMCWSAMNLERRMRNAVGDGSSGRGNLRDGSSNRGTMHTPQQSIDNSILLSRATKAKVIAREQRFSNLKSGILLLLAGSVFYTIGLLLYFASAHASNVIVFLFSSMFVLGGRGLQYRSQSLFLKAPPSEEKILKTILEEESMAVYSLPNTNP